jgi:carbonic anhydrase
MSAHTCDAMVVCCIDFRFQKFIRDWTDKELAGKTFDMVGFAGSTKDLETVMKQLDISVRLHQIKQLILIHHEECGAYGAESTPERHSLDLKKAHRAVLAKYPDLQVDLYYLHLDGTFERIA